MITATWRVDRIVTEGFSEVVLDRDLHKTNKQILPLSEKECFWERHQEKNVPESQHLVKRPECVALLTYS